MLPAFTFRYAQAADAGVIAALVNSAYRGEHSRQGWTTEADLLDGARTDIADVAALIAKPASILLLCLADDMLVGSVHLEQDGALAKLGMFSVTPAQQARGIGKALMAEAETAVASRWQSQKIIMHVISVRTELIAFYARRGYRLTGNQIAFPVHPDLWTPKVGALVLVEMEKLLLEATQKSAIIVR